MTGGQHGADWVTGFHSLEELYRGRTAVLYRAVRSSTGAHAVLKVMRDDERSEREITAVRALAGQPGVVTLLDLGRTTTGEWFLAMPHYPEGSYAAAATPRGRLTVREVAAVGRAVAAGLTSVHARGLLHNDVTPGNILRAGSGAVLTDFGSVGRVGEPPVPGELRSETTLHAPPEALRGEPLSVASDVYRLASTLWALLAGRAPFAVPEGAPGPEGYRDRVLSMPAHPVPDPDVPERMQQVLLRALAKDPADRYTTPAEFAAALEKARVAAPAPQPAPPRGPQPEDPATAHGTRTFSPRLRGRGLPPNQGGPDLTAVPQWTPPSPPTVLSAPTGPHAPSRPRTGGAPPGPPPPAPGRPADPPRPPAAPSDTGTQAPPTGPVRTVPERPAPAPPVPDPPTGPSPVPDGRAPEPERRHTPHSGPVPVPPPAPEPVAPRPEPPAPEQHAAARTAAPAPGPGRGGDLREWWWTRLEGWTGTAETAALPRDDADTPDGDRRGDEDEDAVESVGLVVRERRPLYLAAVVLAVVFFSGTSGMLSLLYPGPRWEGGPVPQAAAEPTPSAQPSPTPSPSPSPSTPALVAVEPTGIWMHDNGTSVQLFWIDNTEGNVPHHVFGAPQGLPRVFVLEAEPGAETAIVGGLDPALEYCFTVAAVAGEQEDQIVHSGVICTTRAEDLQAQQQEEAQATEEPTGEASPGAEASPAAGG